LKLSELEMALGRGRLISFTKGSEWTAVERAFDLAYLQAVLAENVRVGGSNELQEQGCEISQPWSCANHLGMQACAYVALSAVQLFASLRLAGCGSTSLAEEIYPGEVFRVFVENLELDDSTREALDELAQTIIAGDHLYAEIISGGCVTVAARQVTDLAEKLAGTVNGILAERAESTCQA
jgi:hypothetical protein